MTRCSLCGNEDLCFTCPYCNGVYCSEHRLPESHGCPNLHLAKKRAKQQVSETMGTEIYKVDESIFKSKSKTSNQRRPRRRGRKKRFSSQERKDLGISIILVILVGIALQSNYAGAVSFFPILNSIGSIIFLVRIGYWWVPVTTIGIFLSAYLIHEFAHKFTAQSFGMWAEFRMTMQGYYLSTIAILFAIPIFGTGVVFTSGAKSMDEEGKVNVAGPLSNFILAVVFAGISIIVPLAGLQFTLPLTFVLQGGIVLNAFLGLFNMIPFQPFDGGTVFKWNRVIWAALAVALVFMLIFGYLILPSIYAMFSL